ncbi:MAG: DUF2336 domain-containing protein [Pseudomonadota bacterium]
MTYVDAESTLFDGSAAQKTLNDVNAARLVGQKLVASSTDASKGDALELLNSDSTEAHQVLAFEVRLAPDLPGDIAQAIATSGDPDVAEPFLQSSPVVTEEFLLNIVSDLSAPAQSAVAKRTDLTDTMALALIEHGNDKVALSIVRNDKVDLDAATYAAVTTKFPGDDRIGRALQSARGSAARRKHEPQEIDRQLPFNVLVSRARAFQKNEMLSAPYMIERINAGRQDELEAALCVLSDMPRKNVRAALLTSHETRVALEQHCGLAPGSLSSNADSIEGLYVQD